MSLGTRRSGTAGVPAALKDKNESAAETMGLLYGDYYDCYKICLLAMWLGPGGFLVSSAVAGEVKPRW